MIEIYKYKTWNVFYREQADPLDAFCHIITLQGTQYNDYKAFKRNHQYIPGFTPDNIEEIDAAVDYLVKEGYHICDWTKNGIYYIEYINEDEKND